MILLPVILLVLVPQLPIEEQLTYESKINVELGIIDELAEYEPEPQQPIRNVWDRLAECESGNWIDGGASFEVGSARWYWARPGTEIPPWGTSIHHGGLQFHPDTWNWLKPEGYPQYAYDATREQQIAVAERVLEAQGWRAWPVCSRKLGLR